MKRATGRLVAALMLGAVVATPATPSARAEEPVERSFLRAVDCKTNNPTPADKVPQAWHIERLHMEQVWKIATGKGVKVAVIDTGVANLGSVFFNNTITSYDLLGGMSEAERKAGSIDCQHGTKVAALLAGARPGGTNADPRTNFAGIAPDVQLITYRVLHHSTAQDGSEDEDTLYPTIAAVKDATAQGVDVINLSQSAGMGAAGIPEFQQAVAAAIEAGIVVVAAAGNKSSNLAGPAAPASFPGVISVGASTRHDAPADLTYPGKPTVGAPGFEMTIPVPSVARDNPNYNNLAYETMAEGTSFAAPIVAGVVALMLEKDPTLTPAEVKARLEATADPPSVSTPQSQVGFGIVNPFRALAGLERPMTPNPSALATVAPTPLVERPKPNLAPAFIGVGIGVGALLATAMALVAAVAIPPAVRRGKAAKAKRA